MFGLADIEEMKSQGRDLTVFLDKRFKSLRCTSVNSANCDEADAVRCLVALAEDTDAFDETENWYLAYLGQILGLHRRMTQPVPDAGDAA